MSLPALELDYAKTAVVAIDLQHSTVARQLAPHSSASVVDNSRQVTDALRARGASVIFVRVEASKIRPQKADISLPRPTTPPPANAFELVDNCGLQEGDEIVVKRQWGAFYGTALEQVLRRKGITTVVMTGIATNIGVESTARQVLDLGFDLVFVEDAMSSIKEEWHRFAIEEFFPLMGRVRSTEQILAEASAT